MIDKDRWGTLRMLKKAAETDLGVTQVYIMEQKILQGYP